MHKSGGPNVLWMTNLPAPYRFPVWDRMAESVNLHVVFILKRHNWRNWPEPSAKKWRHSYLSLNSIRIKEHDFIPSFRGSSKILRDVDIVIVGGWENIVFIRTILLAKKRGIPVIQFYESTDASQKYSKGLIARIRKWIFQRPNFFITISHASASTLKRMEVYSKNIVVLFNPVDVSWFYQRAQKSRKIQGHGHQFLYVGQLIERKNIANVIRAFSEIREDQDELTIAGDGPLRRQLQELSSANGLQNSVHFVGHKSEEQVAELYAKSNTLVLASTNEVWGLVVNEALASGLHVVVSGNCGVAEFAKQMAGTYICSTNLASIKEAMLESSRDWKGHLQEPEILQFTPEKFADQIIHLITQKIC